MTNSTGGRHEGTADALIQFEGPADVGVLRLRLDDSGPAPDVYFTAAYGAADASSHSGAAWVCLEAFEGRWQLPLLVRSWADVRDAVSPYGYSGVFNHASLTRPQINQAWVEARRWLARNRIVSLFLRTSPLLPEPRLPDDAVVVVGEHPTRVVDIGERTVMWDAMEGRSRTSIRRAAREGLRATIAPASQNDLAAGSDFRTIYESTMRKRQAGLRYYFPDQYYERLQSGLGNHLILAVARLNGVTVSAALFMRHGDKLHYHLSGATPEGASRGGTNLVVWEAMTWASDHGVSLLHLGGGVSATDSLYKFKRSFGGRDLPYEGVGLVIDTGQVHRLTEERAAHLGVSAEVLRSGRSFPSYRAEGAPT